MWKTVLYLIICIAVATLCFWGSAAKLSPFAYLGAVVWTVLASRAYAVLVASHKEK